MWQLPSVIGDLCALLSSAQAFTLRMPHGHKLATAAPVFICVFQERRRGEGQKGVTCIR